MIHLALADDFTVLAQFMNSGDAAEYCRAHGACHVPFDACRYVAPLVGTKYQA